MLDLGTIGGPGLFPRSEENLRIVNIRVLRLGIEPPINPQAGDEVSLHVEHGGTSIVRTSAGNRPRSYQFVHYTEDSEVPVRWGARYFPNGGDLAPISRSLSTHSLLGALLQKTGTNPRDAGYFTYLGAQAELQVRVEQRAAAGLAFRLSEVALEIEYEFVPRASSMRSLDVSTADGLAPYLKLSTPDLSNRQDGLGNLARTYSTGDRVVLSAPDRIGNLRFAGFEDLAAPAAGLMSLHNAHPVVPAERRTSLRDFIQDEFDGLNHQLTLNMESDQRIEVRYTSVDVLSLAIQRNEPNGELLLRLDGERYTPFKLEQAAEVLGPWLPLNEGILTDPTTVPVSGAHERPGTFYRVSPK